MEDRLRLLLKLAIKYHATDIHFMLTNGESLIEMRIDGVCRKVKSSPLDRKMIRYLQYLSNLDVGIMRQPQTGQFEFDVDGQIVPLRFAVINDVSMMNGVLRILNSRLEISVSNLSKIEVQNNYFKRILKKDCGLIIFSGPTGSGKTTSLYTLLKSVKGKKIYSIEDPIEIRQDDMVQLSINESTGFDYEKAIEQILRHDPDIIMVGEIRDSKAALGAVKAANTGHLVLTTLHASKASSCISRMVELGVNESHLYENLITIVNQRMMHNSITHQRQVIFEIMDLYEIEYYRQNGRNSESFYSISRQIEQGIENGSFT